MKLKIYIASFLLLVTATFYAQVGIGTTSPNASSMLDITSTNSGLLIPRVALTGVSDTSTISSPATSLLVYNSGFAPNGYYYFNGTIWVQLSTGINNDWSLTGNTGTNPTTNFLGTTDDKDIIFKRYNIRAGYIGDPVYDASFNFNNGNTAFGANSLLNPSINVGLQNGVRNTAFGVNVMPGLTTGRINTGIGEFALFSNTTGIGNTAIGSGSLFSNSTAGSNVAIGRNALTTSNADNNTAVGFAALRQNASGTNNTALGFEALRGVLGSGNIGIGYQAGRNETGSNKLYIENSSADQNSALIYGDFSTSPKVLRANGQFQIGNPSVSGYALPTTRGTAGQFLQTDGAGGTSWASNTGIFPYTTTGAATGTYNVTNAQHTIRVFGSITNIVLPTPIGNTGKIFVIIGSYGISSKGFTSAAGIIYDDVTNTIITTISSGVRYTVQSDGTDWIVIAN
ncbi:MAG TPA: hypothetical protein PKN96_07495 [Flavobacterium sp.]|uniref:hypothetical protein n=1 Tax=Flavobacterium sp. TaxID=239 RepID=UPI002BBEDEF4|nr:hypothetical protein [Flavobacterium sp.]HNP33121.1 hypothetical protein [Flavobacterium sp.]